MTADDLKDLDAVVNVMRNERLKAAAPKKKPAKAAAKRRSANVERDATAAYDDDEYVDFM